LFEPVERIVDGKLRILIPGIAHNDSLIEVYFDNEFFNQFQVVNHPSGTAYFVYEILGEEIALGQHQVYMIAYDKNNKASNNSNTVSFENKKVGAYQVQNGDSLWKIAEQFYGDGRLYTKIVQANQADYPSLISNPSLIYAGWDLNIPPV
jgi:nucleoid-associated protein YgaU